MVELHAPAHRLLAIILAVTVVLRRGEGETKMWFYQTSLLRLNCHRERLRNLKAKGFDEGLTFETSAFLTFHGGNSNFINSFDKTTCL